MPSMKLLNGGGKDMTLEQRIENLETAVKTAFVLIKELADIIASINEEVLKKLDEDKSNG